MAKSPQVPNIHANAVSGLDHDPLNSAVEPAAKVKGEDPNETADHATSGNPDAILSESKAAKPGETAPNATKASKSK